MKRVHPLVLLLLLAGAGGALWGLCNPSDSDERGRDSAADMLGEHDTAELEGRVAVEGPSASPSSTSEPAKPHSWRIEVRVAEADLGRTPVPGVTVCTWLTRPGVRRLLGTAKSNAQGIAAMDASALERVPPVLRALSRIEIEAARDGWFLLGEEPGVHPGHAHRYSPPAWPTDDERTLRMHCTLSDAGHVLGRVLTPSGEPAAGAAIKIDGQDKQTLTRTDGRFALPIKGLRTTRVHIVHAEHGRWSSDELRLEATRTTSLGTVTLEKPYTITGRFVDAKGRGIADLGVRLRTISMPMGHRHHGRKGLFDEQESAPRARTDAAGRFTLAVGAWMVSSKGLFSQRRLPPFLELDAFVWGSPQTFAITDEDGELLPTLRFVVPLHRARMHVLLPDGRPVADAELTITASRVEGLQRPAPKWPFPGREQASTDKRGRYDCFLPAGVSGRVTIGVRADHATAPETVVESPEKAGAEDVRIVLQPLDGTTGLDLVGTCSTGQVVGSLSFNVLDDGGRTVASVSRDAGRIRLPLPPGPYTAVLHCGDTKEFGAPERTWHRYGVETITFTVPERAYVDVVHAFTPQSYVRVLPAIDKGETRLVALPLRAQLVGDDEEKPVADWFGHWWFEGDLGYAQAVEPGTYDLKVTGEHVESRHVRVRVGAGELVDARVTLEWKQER